MESFKQDLFESGVPFIVEEAKGDINGKAVLGKIKGPFFVPDGVSRNNRFYSKLLWEKTLDKPEIKKKISERRMFGTISHEQPLDDKALLEGRISHIVTDLKVEKDGVKGFGEALILDTPSGKILNTFLRAGSKLFVSSRANGAFKGEVKGVPAVDPESYDLYSFDFVMDPGFLQAHPQLAESLKETLDEIGKEKKVEPKIEKPKGDKTMGENQMLLENVLKEKAKMEADLEKSLDENEKLKSDNLVLTDENNALKEQMKKHEEMEESLKKYEELGTPDEISEALDLSETKLNEYKELGSAEEVSEALDKAKDLIESYQPLGTPEEIEEAFDKSKKVVTEYRELGTPSEIAEAFDKFEGFVEANKEKTTEKRIVELAKELGVNEDKIRKLYGKMTEEEIKEFFADMKESHSLSERFKKTKTEEKKEDDDEDIDIHKKSRGMRLIESFSR